MPLDLARLILLITAIIGLIVGSMIILSPFFTAAVWAVTVVVACWPIMLRVQHWMGGRRALAVIVMTTLMLLVFIVPLLLAVQTIVENAAGIAEFASRLTTFEMPQVPGWASGLPLVGPHLAIFWSGLHDAGTASLMKQVAPYAVKAAQYLAAQAGSLGLLVVHFMLTVIIAAVMFAQGEAGAERLLLLARRVGGDRGEEVLRLAAAAIRGVALGVVVTALLQTVVAAIGLYISGVPYAGLLIAAILILSIAQIGAAPIMIPAVLWLFWSGATGWGIFMVVWTVLVTTMDNFVRPVLIRRGADLPLLLIFAGVIGGLLSMGLVGLFVGPVVLAVTYRLFEAWASKPQAGPDPMPSGIPAALPVAVSDRASGGGG